jgi:hypothetical protein
MSRINFNPFRDVFKKAAEPIVSGGNSVLIKSCSRWNHQGLTKLQINVLQFDLIL